METMNNTTSRDTEPLLSAQGFEQEGTDIRELIGSLLEAKWIILGVAAVVLMLGLAYAFFSAPIYSTDALVQVEQRNGEAGGLTELTALLSGDAPTEAEIEIIRSRSIIGSAVDSLKLFITIEPDYFPVFGSFMARLHSPKNGVAPAFLGLSGYAWGGERVRIDSLTVPEELENKRLTLLSGAGGAYTLLGPDGERLIQGTAGRPAENGRIFIAVTELKARPGTEFGVIRQSTRLAIAALQKRLQVREQGKKTGIIQISLEGTNKAQTTEIVNAIATQYLVQNVERRSEEAKKMLEFLNTQMPGLKEEVHTAEAALSSYRSRNGAVNVGLEAQAYLQAIGETDKQLAMMKIQKAELEQKYTGQHPSLIALADKMARLEADRQRVNGQFKHLPAAELDAVRLERDAKVSNDVYVALLNKTQELSVAKAGTVGNVRIIDKAELPMSPVKPKKSMIGAVSLLLGLFLGVGLVLTRNALFRGIEDPNEVERRTGLPVYATIPHSAKQRELEIAFEKGRREGLLLTKAAPGDLSIESLRSLRTSLQFALLDSPNRIISISGPSPSIGKSFVSANLAAVLAETGKQVLVIDGDMRKGHLKRHFSTYGDRGLSELISGTATPAEVVVPTELPNLSLMSSGTYPPNPSELLMNDRFQALMAELKEQYDFVVIDTPPLLAVTDAAIVGRHAGINFIVMKSGSHDMQEIELCHKRLNQNGVRVQGVIFNDMPLKRGKYGYGYGYKYHYSYDYSSNGKNGKKSS